MYRYSNSFGSAQHAAPAPRNAWEQAERILEILERNPIQPPGAVPQPERGMPQAATIAQPGMFQPYPAPAMGYPRTPGVSPLEEWLRKPLRESNYLRGMGIGADDPFWDTYEDPRLENGGPPPESTVPSFSQAPPPLPDWPRSRPMEIVPFGADAPPAPARASGPGDYGHGLPVPPPPAPEPDDDLPPRIVAVVPHRNDREIADEIFATMQRNDAAQAHDAAINVDGADNSDGSIPPAQLAQLPSSWSNYAAGLRPSAGTGDQTYIPAAAKDGWLWKFLTGRKEPLFGGGGSGGSGRYTRPHAPEHAPPPRNLDPHPSTPVGRRGDPLEVKDGTNPPGAIRTESGPRDYSGHSFDKLQREGITPRSVENVIRPDYFVGKVDGKNVYYDPVNGIRVITNAEGRVVSVYYNTDGP